MKKYILSIILSLLLIPSIALSWNTSPFGPTPPDNTAYNAAAWDGSYLAPTQNAVRDWIEGAGGGGIGGTDTQVQYNNGGAFGGDAGLVYNFTTDTLKVGNVVIVTTLNPETGNTVNLGTALLPFRDAFFTGTVTAPIYNAGIANTQPGSIDVHHGGLLTIHDDGNDTNVILGPVTDDTTTLGIAGSLDVSGSVATGPTSAPAISLIDSDGDDNDVSAKIWHNLTTETGGGEIGDITIQVMGFQGGVGNLEDAILVDGSEQTVFIYGDLGITNGNLIPTTLGKGVDFSVVTSTGHLAALTLSDGGTGYTTGALVITGGGGTGATGTFIAGAGIITSVTITSGGSGYTSVPTIDGDVGGNSDAVIVAHVAVMTSELLANYEEGTWEPAVEFGGNSVGVTYGASSGGIYTKIGRTVYLSGIITLTNKGTSTGNALITGFPSTPVGSFAISIGFINALSFVGVPIFSIQNAAEIVLQEVTEGGVVTALTDAEFDNSTQIIFSVTYSE